MSLAELQAAFAQLPPDDRDQFLTWAASLPAIPSGEEYTTWFRAKIDAALRDAEQRPTYSHEEIRRRFGRQPQ